MIRLRGALVLAAGLSLAACQTDAPAQNASPVLARTESRPSVAPDRLIGLSELDIKGLYGQPNLKRKENGAELWQYADASCVMDLYIYEEAGTKRVSYVTLRDPSTGRVGGAACQEQLSKLSAH